MSGISVYEFDALATDGSGLSGVEGVHMVPPQVYAWLQSQCQRVADQGDAAWMRLAQRRGRAVIQVTSFVGVICAPDGYQIEVLPKVGKSTGAGAADARKLLIDMLCCLQAFRHIQTESAKVSAARMPLLEIFILEFLRTVGHVVKRGLRGDYRQRQDNLFALRGKLLMAPHMRLNLFRADRFFTEHDEFSADRPENRLLHAALRRAMALSSSQDTQKLARELDFVFADIPASAQPRIDFQQVRLDRGMHHYGDALAWARVILEDTSPLTSSGGIQSPSLLYPMEALFEAFVAKHLARQLPKPLTLVTQSRRHHLIRHRQQSWFLLKPDLLIRDAGRDVVVLDTKWKLLDAHQANGTAKYGLLQSDFYQLHAYGQSYLDGKGDIVLIYPKTAAFEAPLPVFEFPKSVGLRLWVVPFCLQSRRLLVPVGTPLEGALIQGTSEILPVV